MLARTEEQLQEFIGIMTGIEVVRADSSVEAELPYVSWGFRLMGDVSLPKVKHSDESDTQIKETILTTSEYSITLNFYTDSKTSKGKLASEQAYEFKNKIKLSSINEKINTYDFAFMRFLSQQTLDDYTGKAWERREMLEMIITSQTGISGTVDFIDLTQPVNFIGTYE